MPTSLYDIKIWGTAWQMDDSRISFFFIGRLEPVMFRVCHAGLWLGLSYMYFGSEYYPNEHILLAILIF